MLDPRIRLRHLVTLLEVARQGAVGKAAEVLGVSQPAVSKTLAELEAILGVALFDRSRRRPALTAFGEVFRRHAEAAVAALSRGVAAVGEARTAGGIVRVGALPTVSARVLPAAVRRYGEDGPWPRVNVLTGPNAFLIAELVAGRVDLVVGRMAEPEAMVGLAFEHLYSERVVFVVRPGHPLATARRFDLAAIAGFPVMTPPPDAIIRPAVDRFLLASGLGRLESVVETVSDAFGRGYVRGGDVVWIISEGVVVDDLADGRLVALPVDTSETLGPVGLTTRAEATASPAAERLARAIRAVVAEQAGPASAGRGVRERDERSHGR